MAEGKLNLYALGQAGVNVVKSAIQLKDDECRSAQNAIVAPAAAGGLQKRGSLRRLNATRLNSGADILSILGVPLPNPFNTSTLTRAYLYLGQGPNDNAVRTADGVTWEEVELPDVIGTNQTVGLPELGLPTVQPLPGFLLYLDDNGGGDDIKMFDGTSDQLVLVIPPVVTPAVTAYSFGANGYHAGDYYFGTFDDPNGRVYRFNPTTGQLTMINGAIGTNYTATAITSFVGKLFVAASDLSTGAAPNSFVYQCDPYSSTAWTLDSVQLNAPVTSMVNFLGNLYLATGTQNAAIDMKIYKRTPSGTYTTVFTDATPWNVQSGGAMIVFNNTLFAYMAGLIVKSTDGAAWTTDLDVFTTYGSLDARTGMPVIFNNELYWAFREGSGTETHSRVLKRTTGGVWSVVYGPTTFGTAGLTVLELP